MLHVSCYMKNMSLIYSAILPHSPVLIPGIAISHAVELNKTITAAKNIGAELISKKPDLIIILSPHGIHQENFATYNVAQRFTASFEEFGDLGTKLNLQSDKKFVTILKKNNLNLKGVSLEKLDYGSAVPLTFLEKITCPILPIYSGIFSIQEQINFGSKLSELIQKSPLKIALVASIDLSHKLNRRSPAGFSPRAKAFDKKIIKALETKDTKEILKIKQDTVKNIESCSFETTLIMLGAMQFLNLKFEQESYESPMGIGWLCGKFE